MAPNNVNAQLYGVCTAGGANGFGTIYSYNATTYGYTKRFDMTGAVGGAAPFAELAPFGNAMYGKIEYRHYFVNGGFDDSDAVMIGIGTKF